MKTISLVTILAIIKFSSGENNSTESGWNFRIVGGQNAYQNQFPYIVALYLDYGFRCGGSIIRADGWVLTAAHCIYGISNNRFLIQAGTIRNQVYTGPTYGVERSIVHERYGTLNDIALMKIRGQFQLGYSVQTIQINRNVVPDNAPVTILGWGYGSTNGNVASSLRYVTLRNLPYRECLAYNKPGIICMAHNGYQGACFGDSGGPAVYNGKLVGVANFVINSCASSYADGYADVSYFANWIDTRINQYKTQSQNEEEQEILFM